MYKREIILDLIITIVDFVPILTILYLHSQNFKKDEPVKEPKNASIKRSKTRKSKLLDSSKDSVNQD